MDTPRGQLLREEVVQRFWRDANAGRVHAANDPERAYKMFGTGEFGLPVMDGLEVCRRLRAAGNPVPVLILTHRRGAYRS